MNDDRLAGLETESDVLERFDHLAAGERAEIAAFIFGPGVIGIFFRQSGEIGAMLKLLEDVLGLGLGGGLVLGAGAGGGADQDVAGMDFGRVGEHGLGVIVVEILDVLIRGLTGGGQGRGIIADEGDFKTVRLTEDFLVLGVELGDFLIGGVNPGGKLGVGNRDVGKREFGSELVEGAAGLGGTDLVA